MTLNNIHEDDYSIKIKDCREVKFCGCLDPAIKNDKKKRMKKNLIFNLILSLILALTFTSCKKDGPAEPTINVFANFSFDSENDFRPPSEITFTNLSDVPEEAGIAEYSWSFGDGSSNSSLENPPPHTYSKQGEYMVRLIVTTPNAETDSITQLVTIKPPYEAIFSESFEDLNPDAITGADLPNTWVVIDNDGGTPDDQNLYTAAWRIIPNNYFDSDIAVATSYYTDAIVPDADDWMISPAISLAESDKFTVLWDAMSLTESGNWPASYQVYISTTTQDIAGCTDASNGKMIREVSNESWAVNATDITGDGIQSYEIDISEFEGKDIYVGFRLMTPAPDASELGIDNIMVYKYFN